MLTICLFREKFESSVTPRFLTEDEGIIVDFPIVIGSTECLESRWLFPIIMNSVFASFILSFLHVIHCWLVFLWYTLLDTVHGMVLDVDTTSVSSAYAHACDFISKTVEKRILGRFYFLGKFLSRLTVHLFPYEKKIGFPKQLEST